MGITSDPSNARKINSVCDHFVKVLTNKHVEILSYVGEDFVNNARDHSFANQAQKGAYTNITRVLLGSTGYVIALNGKVIKSDIQGTTEGVNAANKLVNAVLRDEAKGLVLIAFAGAEYAAAVEARGYDVITASTDEASKLLKELIQESR
jgi:hypothetical protein